MRAVLLFPWNMLLTGERGHCDIVFFGLVQRLRDIHAKMNGIEE